MVLATRAKLTEVSFKPWCAARQTMAATQAFTEIVEGGVAPADDHRGRGVLFRRRSCA